MSREKWISVRVTEEENRAIEEKMKQHGIQYDPERTQKADRG